MIFLTFNPLQFSCVERKECPSLKAFWQKLANTLTSVEGISVAQVDCDSDPMCRGKESKLQQNKLDTHFKNTSSHVLL